MLADFPAGLEVEGGNYAQHAELLVRIQFLFNRSRVALSIGPKTSPAGSRNLVLGIVDRPKQVPYFIRKP